MPRANHKPHVNISRHRVVVTIGGVRHKLRLGDEVTATNDREEHLLAHHPKLAEKGKDSKAAVDAEVASQEHKSMNDGPDTVEADERAEKASKKRPAKKRSTKKRSSSKKAGATKTQAKTGGGSGTTTSKSAASAKRKG